ncbi:hypothetical protein BGZ47_000419 [Haplosporangium gracile]|nr:hypothetical protein BGZ47_000419 [Haplosporangium gracile]
MVTRPICIQSLSGTERSVMVCPSHSSTDQSVFKKWPGGLKMRMWKDFRIAFRPDVVVTDQGNVEILAIRAAFPLVRQALHKILYTLNKDEACALLEAFQADNHHRPEMLQFLDKNYFKEMELQRWMICYRENIACPAIDTKSYVESWYFALNIRGADMVVYVLAKSVISFYQYKLTT